MIDFQHFSDMVYPYLESEKIHLVQNVYDRSHSLEEIETWRKDILNQGYQLRIMPDFRLQNLTRDELDYLRRYRYDPEWNYLLFNEETYGKPCSTGKDYIFLKNNGDALRCAQSGKLIGNLLYELEPSIEANACPVKTCGTSIREFTHIFG